MTFADQIALDNADDAGLGGRIYRRPADDTWFIDLGDDDTVGPFPRAADACAALVAAAKINPELIDAEAVVA